MAKIVISRDALVAMVVTATEVYRKECYGLLLGKKSGKNTHIRDAMGFQTAKRDYYSTTIFIHREKRVNDTLKFLSGHKLVGDFHSHTNGSEHLSRADKEMLMETGPGFVSLLLNICRTKKSAPWKYNVKTKALTGSIGRKYFIKLQAYCVDELTEKIKKLQISCPKKTELNKRMKQFSRLEHELKKVKKEERKTKRKKKTIKKKLSDKMG